MSPNSALAELPHRRFTRDEVLRMVEVGILRDREPLQLLDGELVEMSPQDPAHASTASLLGERLRDVYRDRCNVRQAAPINAGENSLPEPDVAVVSGSARDFVRRHPRGDETVLVVEVSRTSRALHRVKAAIYARSGVPVYWLVDVVNRRIEVHEEPQPDGRYRLVRVLSGSDTLAPPSTTVLWTVAELLPE